MRTTTTSKGTQINYPDYLCFCFDPFVISASNDELKSVSATINNEATEESITEQRIAYDGKVVFGLHQYLQSMFKNPYDEFDERTSNFQYLSAGYSIEIKFLYNDATTETKSLTFNCIYGAGNGKHYKELKEVTWFTNFPFSIALYANESDSDYADIEIDNYVVELPNQTLLQISLTERELSQVGDIVVRNVNSREKVMTIHCNNTIPQRGIYLRWVDLFGRYCYYLFTTNKDNRQVTAGNQYLRNNLHTSQENIQRMIDKQEVNTIVAGVPSCDSNKWDFLFSIAQSPIIWMWDGLQWVNVNISAGTFSKDLTKELQDFSVNVILPDTNISTL